MANRTSSLTLELIDDVSRPARSVAQAMADAERKARAAAAAMGEDSSATDRLVNSLNKLDMSKADIEAVSKAWVDYTKASNLAADSSNWTKEQIGNVRSWETQTLSSVRAVMRERDAETRAMRNAAAEQADILRKQGIEQAKILSKQAEEQAVLRKGAFKEIFGGGAMGMIGGAAMVGAAKASVVSGADIQKVKSAMQNAGIPAGEINAAALQAAQLVAQYPSVSVQDATESYKELRSMLRDPKETPGLMPSVIAAKSALNAIDPSGELSKQLQMAERSAEIFGLAQDPARFRSYLDASVKALQVMGDVTITPEQLFDFAKSSGASGATLSDRFKTTTGMSLIQELGGGKAGTGVDMFAKQLVGGFQGAQHAAAKEFVALGLADKDDFETTKTGEIKGYKPGRRLASGKLASSDPDTWVKDILLPALAAHGFTNQDDQINEVRRLFPNKSASNLVAKLIQQMPSYEQHAKMYGAATGIDADNIDNAAVQLTAFTTALHNLAGEITGPSMPLIGEGLGKLSHWIGGLASTYTEWAAKDENKDAAKAIGLGVPTALAGGGMYGLWKAFGGGFGLKSSAVALDASAEQLTAAAIALKGGSVADAVGGGAAAAAGGAGLLARALTWLQNSPALAAGSLNVGEASGNQGIADILKKAHPAWSDDDMKKWAREQLAPAAPAFEVRRPPSSVAHPGRDVHSPSTGPYSYTPATSVDTSSIDAAKSKADEAATALGQLGQTVHTSIDTSPIDAAIAKMHELKQLMSNIGSLSSGPGGMGPSLGSTIRGNFSFGGVNGE